MGLETLVTAQRANGLGVITLARPARRNALSIRMRWEILECLEVWRDAPEVRAVLLTGAGPAFCAGFDLDEFQQPERFAELLESSSRYHRAVWHFPKPTLAAVNGAALGGGLDLASLCDIRLAAASASFGHPEIKLGAPPLYTPLRWIVGAGLARDLCLTGRRIDAAEALRIGLVSQVVEGDALLATAERVAASLLEAPQAALEFTKRCLTAHDGRGFDESFAIEHDRAFRDRILRCPE